MKNMNNGEAPFRFNNILHNIWSRESNETPTQKMYLQVNYILDTLKNKSKNFINPKLKNKGTELVLHISHTRYIKNIIELGQLQETQREQRSKMQIKKNSKNLKI